MAIIVQHSEDLPERKGKPIPGAKPPIRSFPYAEAGDPEEVDAFLELLREIHGKPPRTDK